MVKRLDETGDDTRNHLATLLRPTCFPADRDTLVAEARAARAGAEVAEALASLPGDRRYRTIEDVWEGLQDARGRR